MTVPTLFEPAHGDSDTFLALQTKRAGKVKGEAIAPGHEDEIVVKGWSWGMSASSAIGSTLTTARRSYKALTLTKGVDRASTALMAALATNDEIKEGKVTLRRSGGGQDDFYVVLLERGRVASFDQVVDVHGNVVETVSLVFNKITVEFRLQQKGGGAGGATTFIDEIHPD